MNVEPTGTEPQESSFQIEFFFDEVDRGQFSKEDLAQLRRAVMATLHSEDVQSAEISVAVVSGSRMQQLNLQYLNHDYDTDVLSFCLESEEDLGFLLGQLIVSLDFANQQCEALGQQHGKPISLIHELSLYLVHGCLHLVGYDDHEPDDRSEMRRREHMILTPLGMTPVWITMDDSRLMNLDVSPEPFTNLSDERPS